MKNGRLQRRQRQSVNDLFKISTFCAIKGKNSICMSRTEVGLNFQVFPLKIEFQIKEFAKKGLLINDPLRLQ